MNSEARISDAAPSAGSCSIRPSLFRHVRLKCQYGDDFDCWVPPTVVFACGIFACYRCAAIAAARETTPAYEFAVAVSRRTLNELLRLRFRAKLLRAGRLNCENYDECGGIATVLFEGGGALCQVCDTASTWNNDERRLLSVVLPVAGGSDDPVPSEPDEWLAPRICAPCGDPLERASGTDGFGGRWDERFSGGHRKNRPAQRASSEAKTVQCRCLGLRAQPRGGASSFLLGSHPRPDCPACHGTGKCSQGDVSLVPFLDLVKE